ncbi:MAG: phage integrase N-terminal SAM-like domain-containing protein, partial [Acidobacteria bacterium]|nr:phage integrase N-terminal SAM-like domain-containing protein [Acidobacteriota bacterium]
MEHVSRFARHVGRSPARLGPEEIRAYLVYLTTEKQLAPSTRPKAAAVDPFRG